MMMSLFSVFDPGTSIFNLNLNWVAVFVGLIFLPKIYWLINSRFMLSLLKGFGFLHKELKVLVGPNMKEGVTLLFVSVFLMIFLNNWLGLFPYVFTSTAHLVVTLSLAFPLWMSFLVYGWLNKAYEMFAHMVPMGTPSMLMSFMVIIETVSNFIRPITLSVRLAANMIAGHLLLSLVGNQGSMVSYFMLIVLLTSQMLLVILEGAVALIQSYVFVVLSSLYSSEVY